MMNLDDLDVGCWQPSQSRSEIARPDVPNGAVAELDDVAHLVPLDAHRSHPLPGGVRDQSLPEYNTC